MPRYVDPVARRTDVIDALFRVTERDGLHSASLRTVAEEAGLSIGSVRHYFASHHDLMTFAMRSMLDRLGTRLRTRLDELGDFRRLSPAERLRAATDLLAELLPLDTRRRSEVAVFLDFMVASRTDTSFQAPAQEASADERVFVRLLLDRLHETGTLRRDLDLTLETERLAALIDGLSLTTVLRPGPARPEDHVALLEAHLRALTPHDETTD
ncbi:TetR/AcrR family transcriptional regulator [Actinoallomurus iriomotensis]|uniref:TetR family transcriptional regulator n=1 Tax=Actinoallomurus iriomotensis TaxID=478107 RepID=A0A9W6RJ13_9ACTN|nr:TetR family transcriptional regulator C-terminal domain-containing protein [Actinoallomurus iriomotensis]GLY76906.1 TetR family transcriptional regulator [Actinoallomurus iriomotensis]